MICVGQRRPFGDHFRVNGEASGSWRRKTTHEYPGDKYKYRCKYMNTQEPNTYKDTHTHIYANTNRHISINTNTYIIKYK